LACTGVGIALGSVIAGRLSRNYIETGLIPVAALGISLGIALLPGLENPYTMAAAFLLVGVMGGMFIVPLNAIIQFQAEESRLGTILAGNNWVQNVAMLAALGLTASFAILGIDSVQLFYILALVAVIGTGYTVAHLPHSLARILATAILKRRYRIDVVGFENLPQAGPTLLLGNHISWIDWALVQIACPRPLRFVMFRGIYELWYLKPFFKAFGVVPIAAGRSKDSIKTISALLQKGECVCLFPEGAISRNGHLGKFHTGYERMVEGIEDGVIIPFYLHGLWGSSFSRAEQGLREARAPSTRRDLIVAFGKPLSFATQADQLKQKVFELSISAWSSYTQSLNSIPQSWLQTARANASQVALIDSTGTRLSNLQMVATVSCISKAMGLKDGNPNVGVLLPAGPAVAIANLAIQLRGKAAVQLNYTATPSAISAAISDSGVTRVITSRSFLEQLLKRDLDIAALTGDSVELVFMEDLQNAVPRWKLVSTMIQFRLLPLRWYFRLHGESVAVDAPAAILFSSDGGDRPQGIVLSHRNIIANSKQVSDVLNTRVDDVVMSCLPCFHSFGLIVTTMMPLLEGIPAVCHPDPTDTLAISKLVAKYQATILAGTASVLSLYANNKKIHPLMLNSLRLVIASAGGLSEEVRNGFQTRFGKTIYKGYGPTQTAPVVSANIPDAMDTSDWKIQVGNKPGSVGMPLPGTSIRVVDPDSLDELALGEEGLILFCGNQVMLGYLNDEKLTNESIVEVDDLRWYKTRDRGHLTDDGFLVIADGY
jgi:acyl-[acyl-carrier-protein]-phospholipid O-acyltransferase/long-chain-fatty-acid--[acyl-carrier-protein] ligase